jgi:hypothetical protein
MTTAKTSLLRAAIAGALALSAAACASIQPAQMAVPASLEATTETLPMTGIGGWTKGDFAFAGHDIAYARSETRLSVFGLVERNAGYTRYTMRGPSISDEIGVDCNMREINLTLGDAAFTPTKMAFGCDFTANGLPFPARFELQEIREGLGGMLNKKERRGEIALDRVILEIRSVHKLVGTPIEMASPIGYVFLKDGQPVGAVELNGTPQVKLPVTDDVALRRAVITGAVTLALFWDPANSALGD